MKLSPCACGVQHYARVQRSGWMRLFDSRRLYFCQQCTTVAFLRRDEVDRMLIDAAAARVPEAHSSNGTPQ
jgi:hypothetical protein